jgi:hypothetical protein
MCSSSIFTSRCRVFSRKRSRRSIRLPWGFRPENADEVPTSRLARRGEQPADRHVAGDGAQHADREQKVAGQAVDRSGIRH